MRTALKTGTRRVHANIWWDHWKLKDKKQCSPLSGVVFTLSCYLSFVSLSSWWDFNKNKSCLFSHDYAMMAHGCGNLFLSYSYCSFHSLSFLPLSLRNDYSVLMLHSPSNSHFWATVRIPIKHNFSFFNNATAAQRRQLALLTEYSKRQLILTLLVTAKVFLELAIKEQWYNEHICSPG